MLNDSPGLLFIILLLACSLLAHMITNRPRTIYMDRPYKETHQYAVDKFNRDIQRQKEVGIVQWSKEDIETLKSEWTLLKEEPKPGAWSVKDHSEDGPPYFVYRDEMTGKSITAVRGSEMYNQILTGMKR